MKTTPSTKKSQKTVKKVTGSDASNGECITVPLASLNPADDEELKSIVTTNLKNLITKHNLTQKELAHKVGYCEAAVCRYFRGTQFPPIDFLFKLKKLYNISIDDFISRKIIEPIQNTDPLEDEKRRLQEIVELSLYQKYCGTYIVYYLDTSNYKGRDFNTPTESLVYGVINIHEVKTNLNKSKFESIAFLGLNNRKEAENIKEHLDSLSSIEETTDFVYTYKEKLSHNNIYSGDFEFGEKHAYISLKHDNIDRALIVLYRVPTNKPSYIGGLGVINSGSKGREKMPTAQFIAFSRFPLSLSSEEIHHELLLTHPTFKANAEIKELVSMFKNTYLAPDSATSMLSDYQKELMLKVCIEDHIKKIIAQNMDRYAKASERDDSSWYHLLKYEEKKRIQITNLIAD